MPVDPWEKFTYPPSFRAQVLRIKDGVCDYCGERGEQYPQDYRVPVLRGLFGRGMDIDRLDPSQPYTLKNARLLHKSCHARIGLRRGLDPIEKSMVGFEYLEDDIPAGEPFIGV